ncbi:hypothetical protein A134_00615 [Vibrio crassostreae 9CS106]|nr:hypothetical protein A134_00615 [Vibrio crassostreae 9CS106]
MHIPTYVIHPTKGHEEREAHLKLHLPSVGLTDYEIIEEGDADQLSKDIIEEFFGPALSRGGMSCNYKHYLAYKRVVDRQQDYALILENDVFVVDDVLNKIDKIISEVKVRRNLLVNIEEASELVPIWYRKKGKITYLANKNKMAAGYIIDLEFAKNMVDYLESHQVNKNFDALISEVSAELSIRLYWSQPPLVTQGSKDGTFASEISDEQSGTVVKYKTRIRNFYKTHILSHLQPKRLRVFDPQNLD